MSTAYNGRIFNAQVLENQPFVVVWDGQVLDTGGPAIVAGTRNLEAALKFLKFAATPACHRRRRPLHFLQSHAPRRDAADFDARREGRGHDAAHAQEPAEFRPRPAQRLGMVERPRGRSERALQRLAGAVSKMVLAKSQSNLNNSSKKVRKVTLALLFW